MTLNPNAKMPKHQSKPVYSRKVDPTCHPRLATAELVGLRPAVMRNMGETVPEVDIDWFLQYAVPRFSSQRRYVDDLQVIDSVMKGLRGSIAKGRWKWYKADPSKMRTDDDTTFKHMENISDAVLKAGKRHLSNRDPTCRLRCLPRKIGKSEMVNSKAKGNANQLLEEPTGAGKKDEDDFYVVDSVINYEFKKSDDIETVNANVVQLLGSSARILFSDPARRFRWSVSVENTTMRFWFLSRSVCFVSKPFNFVMQRKPFIHFLLATSFASKTDLGYDPTVRRKVVKQEGKDVVAYDYMIEDKNGGRHIWYRTIGEVISNHRANRPLGRAIRVWLVQELNDEGVPFGPQLVLKDYWIALDSLTEGQIQSRIFEAAAKARGNEDFKKYFMSILHDTIVKIEGEEDSSPLHLGGATIPVTGRLRLKKRAAKVPNTSSDLEDPALPLRGNSIAAPASEWTSGSYEEEEEPYIYQLRKHTRLVFKEVGTPLNMIKDQKVLFQCLIDALWGLEVFYDARWVHRDISTGNLLLCYDDNRQPICKISDLEYACPYPLEVPTDAPEDVHKIGTPAFMAVEAQLRHYLFGKNNPSITRFPFLHNYLHDVESVWWISMWHLFHTYPVQEEDRHISNATRRHIKKQKTTTKAIFTANVDGSGNRLLFLQRTPHYEADVEVLLHKQTFSQIMGCALLKLQEYYKLVEIPENACKEELFTGVHRSLVPFFTQARDSGVEVEYCEYFQRQTRVVAAKKDNSLVNEAVPGATIRSTNVCGQSATIDGPVDVGAKGKKRTQTDAEFGNSLHKRRK